MRISKQTYKASKQYKPIGLSNKDKTQAARSKPQMNIKRNNQHFNSKKKLKYYK